ncbi:MAG: hypothetical protein ABT01_01875 [Clostridium sp. SCN 57-10]|nr:MAG: hypothetical protein ABT01_01875 [Clostridium sp. SCN 57-10]
MNSKGIAATVVSAMLFGGTPVLVSMVYGYGATPETVSFYRAVFAAVILLTLCAIRRESLRFTKKQLAAIVLAGICVAATNVLLYSAYDHIGVGTSTTLHFLYPVFVVAGCRLFGEKIGKTRGVALIAACAGMAFFLDPGGGLALAGIVPAVVSAVTYALYMILVDKFDLKSIPPFSLSAALMLVGCVFLPIYNLATNRIVYILPAPAFLLIAAVALLASVCAVVLLQIGIRQLGSGTASIFCTFEPLTGVLFGCLFLQERLTLRSALGSAVILGAVTLLTLGERAQEKRNKESLTYGTSQN